MNTRVHNNRKRVSNVHYRLSKFMWKVTHQECQLRVLLFSKIFLLYLKAWFQDFKYNMAAVATASQSAPPETRCCVDTAGAVLGINDLCIELTSQFPDLGFAILSNVPLVAEATIPSSSWNGFKLGYGC